MITPTQLLTKQIKVGSATVIEVKLGMIYRSSIEQFSEQTAQINVVKHEEERLKRALWYYIYGEVSLNLLKLLEKIKSLDFPRETEPSPFFQVCNELTDLIESLDYDSK